MIQSMQSHNRQIANQQALITCIKDIICPASPHALWPSRIWVLCWTHNLTHFQSFLLACFAFVNGLSPNDFLHWRDVIMVMHLCRNTQPESIYFYCFRDLSRGSMAMRITPSMFQTDTNIGMGQCIITHQPVNSVCISLYVLCHGWV